MVWNTIPSSSKSSLIKSSPSRPTLTVVPIQALLGLIFNSCFDETVKVSETDTIPLPLNPSDKIKAEKSLASTEVNCIFFLLSPSENNIL